MAISIDLLPLFPHLCLTQDSMVMNSARERVIGFLNVHILSLQETNDIGANFHGSKD